MQVFALVPPCPAERALASSLRTNLDIETKYNHFAITFKTEVF